MYCMCTLIYCDQVHSNCHCSTVPSLHTCTGAHHHMLFSIHNVNTEYHVQPQHHTPSPGLLRVNKTSAPTRPRIMSRACASFKNSKVRNPTWAKTTHSHSRKFARHGTEGHGGYMYCARTLHVQWILHYA